MLPVLLCFISNRPRICEFHRVYIWLWPLTPWPWPWIFKANFQNSHILGMAGRWTWNKGMWSISWWHHQMETFFALLAFCAGNHRSPVNSPLRGQWRRALMFSLICACTNSWVNNRDAGNLRRHCAHYDVIVMMILDPLYDLNFDPAHNFDFGFSRSNFEIAVSQERIIRLARSSIYMNRWNVGPIIGYFTIRVQCKGSLQPKIFLSFLFDV